MKTIVCLIQIIEKFHSTILHELFQNLKVFFEGVAHAAVVERGGGMIEGDDGNGAVGEFSALNSLPWILLIGSISSESEISMTYLWYVAERGDNASLMISICR